MRTIRPWLRAAWLPLLFAAVTILAYGLLLPVTGFYWDDWPFAWLARFRGPAEFMPAFAGFRPFLGPIFLVTTSLVPPSPLAWQVLALIVRWLSGLAAWYALSGVWPAHKREALLASLLFLVFPGYSQHWVALTHINQEWVSLICFLFSFGVTARVVRAQQAGTSTRSGLFARTAIALVLLLVGLFPTEYFIGLEPVRLLFIWVIVAEGTRRFWARLLRSLTYWWPYLLVWLADAAWLAYYYKSGAYISYDVTAVRSVPAPAEALGAFAEALWKAGAYVWVQVLVLCSRTLPAPTSLLTLALIAAAFIAALSLLLRFPAGGPGSRAFAVPAVLIGLAAILLGRVPSFAAGLPLTLQSSFDRFIISMMLGGSLLAAGLISLVLPPGRWRSAAFALLIALGVGQQFFNANIFRRDWLRQQDIYWQMAWRMPAIRPGTALLTQQMPLDYETDFSMTAAVNWMYAGDAPGTLPFALIYTEKRLGGVVLPSLEPGTPIRFPFRTTEFNGSTSQVIALYVPPNGCLRVLDPTLGDNETYGKLPESATAPILLSNPSLIESQAPPRVLSPVPFGREPAHGWCYLYEMAERARQARDWERIVALEAQARQQGLAPQDPFEWLPFIEAESRTGNLKAAEQTTKQAWAADVKLHRGLCVLWQRIKQDGPPDSQAPAASLLSQLGCTP